MTALAVDPRNGKHVFAVTTTGIRVSRDGGTNWKTVLRPGAYVDGATFAITRTRPEIDYVAVSMVGPAGCGVNARRHCAATSA